MLSVKNEQILKEALLNGQNIAITGMQGTGKSTVCNEIMRLFGRHDIHTEYCIVEEVSSHADLDFINYRIDDERPVIFTFHSSKGLAHYFPKYNGLNIAMNKKHELVINELN